MVAAVFAALPWCGDRRGMGQAGRHMHGASKAPLLPRWVVW